MDGLIEYGIPVKGLGIDIHQFHFEIGEHFFSQFEGSPIQKGDVKLDLIFDKRSDLYIFEFDFEGSIETDCDRCLAKINLPIAGKERLIIKFSLDQEEEEADVVYISPEETQINVARFIYEFIVLAIPMIKVYDCKSEKKPVCNQDMLDFLENNESSNTEQINNPIWEELKKFDPEQD